MRGHCFDPLFKNGTNEDHSTDSSLVIGLRLREPNDYNFFLCVFAWSIVWILWPPQSLKEILARRIHSESAFIHYARLFGHWKCFWRPENHRYSISSICWNYYAGGMFTARQSDGNWTNSARYYLQTIIIFFSCAQYILSIYIWLAQYTVVLLNNTSTLSVILCWPFGGHLQRAPFSGLRILNAGDNTLLLCLLRRQWQPTDNVKTNIILLAF